MYIIFRLQLVMSPTEHNSVHYSVILMHGIALQKKKRIRILAGYFLHALLN